MGFGVWSLGFGVWGLGFALRLMQTQLPIRLDAEGEGGVFVDEGTFVKRVRPQTLNPKP